MSNTCNILLENGGRLLQEDGYRLLLENCVETGGVALPGLRRVRIRREKTYEELEALVAAEVAAFNRTEKLKNEKAREALEAAAQAAREAIEAAEEAAGARRETAALARSLAAAASAKGTAAILRQSELAMIQAKALMEELANEDDEESIMLLLS